MSLCINNVQIDNPKEIVEYFNDFFVNIGNNLAKAIPVASVDCMSYLSKAKATSNSFALFPVNSKEIIDIVNDFNAKTSFGVDLLPVNIVKKCIVPIAEPLAALINSSFEAGIVPDSLKIAKVCPIFKSGSSSDVGNYRPISVLPTFFKIFERAFHKRLFQFIDSNDVIIPNQFRFRSNFSTYMALQDMYDKITTSLDLSEHCMAVFIDLSKAFDTMNHSILFRKLEHYGIRGLALDWIKSYLANRKQFVSLNQISSTMKNITCGVPQGSILGPLLFTLYINDMVHCSELSYYILFADDTNIFFSCKSFSDLAVTVNKELHNLSHWFCANRLSLNIKKTSYILFGNRTHLQYTNNFRILIDNIPIERVHETKFLRVIVDDHLNWKSHICSLSLKVARNIGVINRIKNVLPKDILLMLYYALIHPYLLYCNIVWGGASQIALYKLNCLHKRAIRVVTKSAYLEHTDPLFVSLRILKLNDIHKTQVLMYMFKRKYALLPSSYCNLITFSTVNPNYTFRNTNEFILPKYRT